MRVQDVKTKVIRDVNASFSARLIEQGKAVPAPATEAEAKAKKHAAGEEK